MKTPRFSAAVLTPYIRDFGKLPKNRVQKPAEPNAFPLSMLADSIHTVVPIARPHQWQAVAANSKTSVQRTGTMLKQCRARLRNARLEIGVILALGQHISVQKRNDFVQHGYFAGCFDEVSDGVRQPQEIVRDAGSHATPQWRMPPVLNIAFNKLSRGGA